MLLPLFYRFSYCFYAVFVLKMMAFIGDRRVGRGEDRGPGPIDLIRPD